MTHLRPRYRRSKQYSPSLVSWNVQFLLHSCPETSCISAWWNLRCRTWDVGQCPISSFKPRTNLIVVRSNDWATCVHQTCCEKYLFKRGCTCPPLTVARTTTLTPMNVNSARMNDCKRYHRCCTYESLICFSNSAWTFSNETGQPTQGDSRHLGANRNRGTTVHKFQPRTHPTCKYVTTESVRIMNGRNLHFYLISKV